MVEWDEITIRKKKKRKKDILRNGVKQEEIRSRRAGRGSREKPENEAENTAHDSSVALSASKTDGQAAAPGPPLPLVGS